MKPQLTGTKKRPSVSKAAGEEAALSLQEELVAAIQGAFEVAVQIAVREVKKLVGQATGDVYEEMRRENESLIRRLQRAEALLDAARMKERGGSAAPSEQPLSATNPTDHPKYDRISPNPKAANVRGCGGIGGDRQGERVSGDEEQRSGDVKTELVHDAASDPVVQITTQVVSEQFSHAHSLDLCAVKIESLSQPCQDSTNHDHHLAPPPRTDDKSVLEQVTVKQEKPEEERDGSACCLDSIQVEGFSLDCVSAVQPKMLEEWESEVPDIQSQDPSTQLSCTRLAQAHPRNMTTGLPPTTDLPSLSSEFPIFQLAEPAPIPEAPAQIYGVHVRTNRNLGHAIANAYACKSCGQTFHLPSLLRRHHAQCPQKLQQRCQQPVAGSKRTRLQLYPPGCSPFRCTECNREFNRMENLKTHLRIHTGERPYTCSVCSKCFRHSGALTRHFRIHTGEKPYICGQCGKSFRNCGGLKFHQRSHSKQLQ